MIVAIEVIDGATVTFHDALCEVEKKDVPGSNGGYPSMAEVARVIARCGDPQSVLKDAARALAETYGCRALSIVIATDHESICITL